MDEETELVTVRTAAGWHLAQIYKSKLDAAEIPALLKYEALGLVYGITVDGLGEVKVLVPREFADDAEALLQDLPDVGSAEEEKDQDVDEELDEEDLNGEQE